MTTNELEDPQAQLLREAEAGARPAVLRGLVANWPAVTLWAGSAGLQHMRQRAGDAVVQVSAHANQQCICQRVF